MAKRLKQEPIEKADLKEFLSSESDFAFELSAIPLLKQYGWTVEHGGTYSDPVTGVNRQFDFRARYLGAPHNPSNQRPWFSVSTHLAIECKNLKANYPLLISCVRRTQSEDYLSIVLSDGNGRDGMSRVSGYRVGDAVGKATDQVGRNEQAEFVRGDSEVYEKWSQAIASSADLLRVAAGAPYPDTDVLCSRIFPILLVPDGTLWECRYNEGMLVREPEPADHVEFYIGKDWALPKFSEPFTISHLEILTMSGFKSWLRDEKQIDANSRSGMEYYDSSIRWLETK